jgi:pimeloyl-ACP methyl ester carboxylesterase
MNRSKKIPDFPTIQEIQSALWGEGASRGAAVLVGAGFSRNAVLAAPNSPRPPLCKLALAMALHCSRAFYDTKKILSAVVSAPEYSPVDDYGWVHGTQFSINVLLPEMMKIDLTKLGPDFRAPVLFFEGRHDPYCPPSLIWEYSQAIKAPHKDFIWFDNAGHFPFFEEQQKFADELFQKVLPLANYHPSRD